MAHPVEDEYDLRDVPWPYICRCGWWRRWKERAVAWDDVHYELDEICRNVRWAEGVIRSDGPSEGVLRYWEEQLSRLEDVHRLLVGKHFVGSRVSRRPGPDRKRRRRTDDPYIRYPVSASDGD